MLMRSKLFVPASRPEIFPKALASAADALSFDLEDAVTQDRKEFARETLAAFLSGMAADPKKIVVVRVNGVDTPEFAADVQAVVGPRVQLINLPAVEDPEAIALAVAQLERAEREKGVGPIRLLINIETPRALRRAAELACAHPRVAGLQVGYADLFEPCAIDRTDAAALAHVRVSVRLAAAEAGVPAYDGALANVKDPDAFRAECLAARRHGFAGKSCIHPSQIALANAAFLPTAAEVERARRVIAAAQEAASRGQGACLVDGQMVDEPFLVSARAIVALSARQAGSPGGEP